MSASGSKLMAVDKIKRLTQKMRFRSTRKDTFASVYSDLKRESEKLMKQAIKQKGTN